MTREDFFEELGTTFMPGTPAMLTPLGLAAYLPSVLDFDPLAGLPDEIALIVYASREAYLAARHSSILGRMYTHSHAGVFDMSRSRGQFPGSIEQPDRQAGTERWSWYAFDHTTDWQQGSTRVVFLSGTPESGHLQAAMHSATRNGLAALTSAGADQMIVLAAPGYAAIWLHGSSRVTIDLARAGFVPAGTQIARDLDSQLVRMPNLNETVRVSGPIALSYRFVRDLRFFL